LGTQSPESSQKRPFAQAASDVHVEGHEVDDPEQTKGAQGGNPAWDFARGTQMPSVPGWLQPSQLFSHRALQQTLSVHSLERHWVLVVQASPSGFSGLHSPAEQTCLSAQSAALRQRVGHLPDNPEHLNGEQVGVPASPASTGVQVPSKPEALHTSHAPLQAELQHTPFTQKRVGQSVAVVQAVPSSFSGSQAPLTHSWPGAHSSLRAHCAGHPREVPVQASGAQVGLPSEPTGLGVQTPGASGLSQASHCPLQAASQHTPSTQKPDTQSPGAVHTSPGPFFGTQSLASQKKPGAQAEVDPPH
jgi:hypothetical protein